MLTVRITDQGGEREVPDRRGARPRGEAAGLQKPRGWGLFLIQNMVDDLSSWSNEAASTPPSSC